MRILRSWCRNSLMSESNLEKDPWFRHLRTTPYENKFIAVYHDEVTRPDGEPGFYGVVHFRNRAIGILALDDQDRVLLVGQFRYPLGEYSWEIVEGGGPMDEEPLDAAKRELKEETGCTARDWQPLGRAHLSNSITDEVALMFLATGLEAGASEPEGTEKLKVQRVPFAEALQQVLDGRITDSISVMAIQRLALLKQSESW